jgi:hypothetical protein
MAKKYISNIDEQLEYDKKHEFLKELSENIAINIAKKNSTLESC